MKNSNYFSINVYETDGKIDFVTLGIGDTKDKLKAIHKIESKDEMNGIIDKLNNISKRF